MLTTIFPLTKSLIEVPSTADNSKAKRKVLEIAKKQLDGFTIEEFDKNGSPSLLAYAASSRPERFNIIFNAHLDVVPAHAQQFIPTEKDGKLIGRGTYDMKAAAAVQILVFKELAKKLPYPLALQLVTDEEVGGFNGTKYQVEQGVAGEFVVVGEPTDFRIGHKAKGIIWATVTTTGESAHGAYPWFGTNAIIKMDKVMRAFMKAYPVPKKEVWKTTINIARIETANESFNKVPDNCTLSLDIRYIPEEAATIEKKLQSILPTGTEMIIKLKESSSYTEPNNQYVKKLQDIIRASTKQEPEIIARHGGSDIRHYNIDSKCRGVEFGPVGGGHHTDNEWVDMQSLEDYYYVLTEFLRSVSA